MLTLTNKIEKQQKFINYNLDKFDNLYKNLIQLYSIGFDKQVLKEIRRDLYFLSNFYDQFRDWTRVEDNMYVPYGYLGKIDFMRRMIGSCFINKNNVDYESIIYDIEYIVNFAKERQQELKGI